MFKLIKMFFSSIFFLTFLTFIFIWIRKEALMENWLSNKLKTSVFIGKVKPSIKGLKIKKIFIYNPKYSNLISHALEIEDVNIEINLRTLFKPEIQIQHLVINQPCFNIFSYDRFSKNNNWSHLLKHFESSSQTTKKVLINKCSFLNAKFRNLKSNGQELSLIVLPSLEFTHNTSYFRFKTIYPTIDQALSSFIYLAFESYSRYPNLPSILQSFNDKSIKEARLFFNSNFFDSYSDDKEKEPESLRNQYKREALELFHSLIK